MRPSRLERGTKQLRRTKPIARIGRTVRSRRALRNQVRANVYARDRTCRVALALNDPHCAGRLDVHEIRSAWPGGELVESNCLLTCRRHHQWIDNHPELAHDIGLHGYSWERPCGT